MHLEHDVRPIDGQGSLRAEQRAELGALDVELDQADLQAAGGGVVVDRDRAEGVGVVGGRVDGVGERVEAVEPQARVAARPEAAAVDADVLEAVQAGVAAQHLRLRAVRLEAVHQPPPPGTLRATRIAWSPK